MNEMKGAGKKIPRQPVYIYLIYITGFFLLTAGIVTKAPVVLRQYLASDNCQPGVAFYDVVFNHNYLFKNWYLTTAPLIFTDFPFYLLSGLVFGMGSLTLKLNAFFIFSMSVLMLALIVYRVFGLSASLFAAAAVFSMPLFASTIVLQPYIHVGTLAFSFLSLLIVMSIIRREAGKQSSCFLYGIIFVLSVLAVFSDPYFVFVLIFPLIFSYVLTKFSGAEILGKKSAAAMFFLLVGATVTGLALHNIVRMFGPYIYKMPSLPVSTFHNFTYNAKFLLKTFMLYQNINFFEEGILFPDILISLLNLLVSLMVISNSVVIVRRDNDPLRRFVYLFFGSVLTMLVLSMLFKSEVSERYLMPVSYIFPFFLSVSIAGGRQRIKKGLYWYLILSAFTITAFYNSYKNYSFRCDQPETKIIRFLEKEKLSYGYSSYTYSNMLTLFSKNNIKVRAVRYDGTKVEPYNWISNTAWFRTSVYEGPTFLMVPEGEGYGFSDLTPDIIVRIFGRPQKILSFENMQFYVWNYNIMKMINRISMSDKTPHITGKAELTEDGEILHASRGEAGLLVYGPGWKLKEGAYRLRFVFDVSGDAGQEVAQAGVSIADLANVAAPPVYITGKVLAGGRTGWREYVLDFTASGNREGNLAYDFIVFATGRGDVRISAIYLEER